MKSDWVWLVHLLSKLALRIQIQEDLCEFEASFVFTASFRLSRTKQWDITLTSHPHKILSLNDLVNFCGSIVWQISKFKVKLHTWYIYWHMLCFGLPFICVCIIEVCSVSLIKHNWVWIITNTTGMFIILVRDLGKPICFSLHQITYQNQ